MIDKTGVEWLTIKAASRATGIPLSTISTWISRGSVHGVRIDGVTWVKVPDLQDAEHKTRGHYRQQRERHG